MDDLISRQAAIDVADDIKNAYYDGYDNGYNAGFEAGQRDVLMKDLPSSQPETRWIPCSERLPDVAQRVLLSGHGQVMVGMLHSFGKYSLEPTGISYVYPKDDIEAWMPLPEPWKEGEKG